MAGDTIVPAEQALIHWWDFRFTSWQYFGKDRLYSKQKQGTLIFSILDNSSSSRLQLLLSFISLLSFSSLSTYTLLSTSVPLPSTYSVSILEVPPSPVSIVLLSILTGSSTSSSFISPFASLWSPTTIPGKSLIDSSSSSEPSTTRERPSLQKVWLTSSLLLACFSLQAWSMIHPYLPTYFFFILSHKNPLVI